MNIKEISLISIDNATITAHMRNTLLADKTTNREEAINQKKLFVEFLF